MKQEIGHVWNHSLQTMYTMFMVKYDSRGSYDSCLQIEGGTISPTLENLSWRKWTSHFGGRECRESGPTYGNGSKPWYPW